MIRNFFIFFWRNLQKNLLFSSLNILGLALGFAGFILCFQYINKETSYDKWNTNYKHIYQVGLKVDGEHTDQTSGALAPAIKAHFPEVIHAGRKIDYFYGSYPLFADRTIFVKKAVAVDSAAAHIFQVTSKYGELFPNEKKEATLATQELTNQLFSDKETFAVPKNVPALSKALGMVETITGVSNQRSSSILDFDLLFVREPNINGNLFTYQTYIQVDPGTDIEQLTNKINVLYQQTISKLDNQRYSSYANGQVYLDPLSHLHLRPKHGSNTPYLTVWLLGILSLIILCLAAMNFVSAVLTQADRRSKEIALKQILGGGRLHIGIQFLAEALLQCLIAATIAGIFIIIGGNILEKWFQISFESHLFDSATVWQLAAAILFTTILSGLYPALILSASRPIRMLKGFLNVNEKQIGPRHLALAFQFVVTTVFITGVVVVRKQVHYIQTSDKGFEASQVINFKAVGMYYDNKLNGTLQGFKDRLIQDPNISTVSVVSNVPGGSEIPPKKQFTYTDRKVDMEHIGIDLQYFEVLDIPSLEGKNTMTLSQLIQDSTRHYAVVNETASKAFSSGGMNGATISGCEVDFEIIGIVKDSKTSGFENLVPPTIYSFKDECGPGHFKSALLVKTERGKTKEAINAVEKEWTKNPSAESLPLDYEFVDKQYARLHAQHEQLENALYGFTCLSLIIAVIGLFSLSANQVNIRKKEMGIRKVLGASMSHIFIQLNRPFLRIVIGANLVAIPLSYIILTSWLNKFPYKIGIDPWIFVWVTLAIIIILLLTISYQSVRSFRTNPTQTLKEES